MAEVSTQIKGLNETAEYEGWHSHYKIASVGVIELFGIEIGKANNGHLLILQINGLYCCV